MTKEEFLKGVENWDNHRHLLWPALENTTGLVAEFGCGHGSTPFLHQYCKDSNREFKSYDNNLGWAEKFKECDTKHVNDWDDVPVFECDVLLVDSAPGERRHIDIQRFANSAKLIVIHDSEQEATGYMLSKIWHLFKYRIDWKSNGAWASCVSNFTNVELWNLK